MSFKGFGFFKPVEIPDVKEKFYELQASDFVNVDEFTLREDLLNTTIIAKTSITNYYKACFLPITLGQDGDFIRFKNIEDTVNENAEPYLEFYGEDWAENINCDNLGIDNVSNGDNYFWIQGNQNEAYFEKENGVWTVKRPKGFFNISEIRTPHFYTGIKTREVHADSSMYLKINDEYTFGLTENAITLGTETRTKHNIVSSYPRVQSDKNHLGTYSYPFGDLHLKGNAYTAEPTQDSHAATKKYVDDNASGGITKLEDDTAPKLAANLDANDKVIDNFLELKKGANGIRLNLGKYLNVTADSVSFVTSGVQAANINSSGLELMKPIRVNADNTHDLGAASKKFKDGYFGGNVTTAEPTQDSHAATKKYVDDNASGGITKLEDDTAPKLAANLDANDKVIDNFLELKKGANGIRLNLGKYLNVTADSVSFVTSGVQAANINSSGLELMKPIRVNADNTHDLGAASKKFKDGYFGGNVTTAEPTQDSHAATKKYVDDKPINHQHVHFTACSGQMIIPSNIVLNKECGLKDFTNQAKEITFPIANTSNGRYLIKTPVMKLWDIGNLGDTITNATFSYILQDTIGSQNDLTLKVYLCDLNTYPSTTHLIATKSVVNASGASNSLFNLDLQSALGNNKYSNLHSYFCTVELAQAPTADLLLSWNVSIKAKIY